MLSLLDEHLQAENKDTDAFLPEIDDKRILPSDWERQF